MSKNMMCNMESVGMSKEHRKIIQSNFDTLVRECKLDLLLPKLIQKQVFSLEMADKYMGPDKRANKRFLFLDVRMRGPEAFYHLVTSLQETGHNHLADLLSTSHENGPSEVQCNLLQSEEMKKKQAKPFVFPKDDFKSDNNLIEEVDSETCYELPMLYSSKFYDNLDSKVRCYSTRSKLRGKVLILNNIKFITEEERSGADVDQMNLLQLFDQMGGFVVETHVNKTFQETKNIISNFVKSRDLYNVDMCFVFILSHGTENKIVTADEAYIPTDWIQDQFSNVNCPALESKPKILVYQACRGQKLHSNIREDVQTDSPTATIQNRLYSDLLICHSTILGYKSHRDTRLGTWYIEKFCTVVKEHAHDTHIESLLKMVDNDIAKLRSNRNYTSQTSTYHSVGFNSHCYIHPGIYEENGQLKKYNVM